MVIHDDSKKTTVYAFVEPTGVAASQWLSVPVLPVLYLIAHVEKEYHCL